MATPNIGLEQKENPQLGFWFVSQQAQACRETEARAKPIDKVLPNQQVDLIEFSAKIQKVTCAVGTKKMKWIIIVLNVLCLLALPVFSYSTHERIEIRMRNRLEEFEAIGVVDRAKLNEYIRQEKPKPFFTQSHPLAELIYDPSGISAGYFIPLGAMLFINTIALAVVWKGKRKSSANKAIDGD